MRDRGTERERKRVRDRERQRQRERDRERERESKRIVLFSYISLHSLIFTLFGLQEVLNFSLPPSYSLWVCVCVSLSLSLSLYLSIFLLFQYSLPFSPHCPFQTPLPSVWQSWWCCLGRVHLRASQSAFKSSPRTS